LTTLASASHIQGTW